MRTLSLDPACRGATPSGVAATARPLRSGGDRSAAYGVAQRLLGVDAGRAGLDDQRQQPLADAPRDVAESVARRRRSRRPARLEPVEHLVGEQQRRQRRREAVE